MSATSTSLQITAPPGKYYARVRAVNGLGVSAASSEASVTVTSSAVCVLPPPAPDDYTIRTGGLQVQLSWSASPWATGYRLEVGSAPARSDLLVTSVGPITTFAATAPPGTFFSRVRAVNACGASVPSAEVAVTLSCVPDAVVPTDLAVTVTGGVAAFSWVPALGATGYRVFVGSAPGLSNVSAGRRRPHAGMAVNLAGVPPGRYYVRVAAVVRAASASLPMRCPSMFLDQLLLPSREGGLGALPLNVARNLMLLATSLDHLQAAGCAAAWVPKEAPPPGPRPRQEGARHVQARR